MARQLKVFSTPAGFVNAVVAAPSQKAALEAWGVGENLFANGRATIVTDPELISRALETPGVIVRVPVGSAEAILKGAKRPPQTKAPPAKAPQQETASQIKRPAAPPPPPPKPDRGLLTKAEAALAAAEARRSEELTRLDEEKRALEARRRERAAKLDGDVAQARRAQGAAERRYREAGGVD